MPSPSAQFKLVWTPKRSKSRHEPGKVHLAFRYQHFRKGDWSLPCRATYSPKLWDADRCKQEGGPTIATEPSASDWPTCIDCCISWWIVLEERGIQYDRRHERWIREWEEQQNLRPRLDPATEKAEEEVMLAEMAWALTRPLKHDDPSALQKWILAKPAYPDSKGGSDLDHRDGSNATATPIFRPKSDAPYIAQIRAEQQQRSRDHERLISDFGDWVTRCGLLPDTDVHPRDLVVHAGDTDWLIEAKMVHGRPITAMREVLAQLLHYRYLYYPADAYPLMLALFSEPIGDRDTKFLASFGIASLWRDVNETWAPHYVAACFGKAETAQQVT